MFYKEQPKKLLQRLLNHTLDHFHIDISKKTIIISYRGKECEVFYHGVEKIYAEAFDAYQEEANRYQTALEKYEKTAQAYLLDKGVTAEDVASEQLAVTQTKPKEYAQWYEELIHRIIKNNWNEFEKAMLYINK